jgi:hypothetical protein
MLFVILTKKKEPRIKNFFHAKYVCALNVIEIARTERVLANFFKTTLFP